MKKARNIRLQPKLLLGLVVIVLGGLMAWDRLKLGKLLSDGDDGIIDV